MRTLKELYKNEKPIGVYGLTNVASVVVYDGKLADADFVFGIAVIDNPVKRFKRKSFDTDYKWEFDGFRYLGIDIPMDEIMRV